MSFTNSGSKPWWSARWDTVEPEEECFPEECYDEPSVNELIDLEFGFEPF